MPEASECAFCVRVLPERAFLYETATCVAFLDAYPCAEGHTLIIPKRCVARVSALTETEWREMNDVCATIARSQPEQEWNIGINDGPLAGQTIKHVHMHMIPRYSGDVADPRGGIRWVKPEQACYW